MRVFIYARDSSRKDEPSTDTQVELCQKWFKLYQDIRLLPITAYLEKGAFCDSEQSMALNFFFREMADELIMKSEPGDYIVAAGATRVFDHQITNMINVVLGLNRIGLTLILLDRPEFGSKEAWNKMVTYMKYIDSMSDLAKSRHERRLDPRITPPLGWQVKDNGKLTPATRHRKIAKEMLQMRIEEDLTSEEILRKVMDKYPHIRIASPGTCDSWIKAADEGFPDGKIRKQINTRVLNANCARRPRSKKPPNKLPPPP